MSVCRSAEQVGDLDPFVTDDVLASAFGQFGEVEYATVVLDPTTHRSRGHGFVHYRNQQVGAHGGGWVGGLLLAVVS